MEGNKELAQTQAQAQAQEFVPNPEIKLNLVGFLQPRLFGSSSDKNKTAIGREDFCITSHVEDNHTLYSWDFTNVDFVKEFLRVFRRFGSETIYKLDDIRYGRHNCLYNPNGPWHRIYTDSHVAMLRLAEAHNMMRNEKITRVPKQVCTYYGAEPSSYSMLSDLQDSVERYALKVNSSIKSAQRATKQQFGMLKEHQEEAEKYPETMATIVQGTLQQREYYDQSHKNCLERVEFLRRYIKQAIEELRPEDDDAEDVDPYSRLKILAPAHTRRQEEVEVPVGRWYFEFKNFSISVYDPHTLHVLEKMMPEISRRHNTIKKVQQWKNYGVSNEERDYPVKGKHKPFDHQYVMAKVHSSTPVSANLSDMGTGKTYGVLMAIDERISRGEIKPGDGRVLVICPNTVVPNWEKEAKLHTPHLTTKVVAGKFIERAVSLFVDDADILIANYDTFSMRMKKPTGEKFPDGEPKFEIITMDGFLGAKKWDMVVLDECHKIKNPEAKRSKGIIKCFRKAKYKVIMTGTINANTLADIYVPFYFLNNGEQFSTELNHLNTNKSIAMSSLRDDFKEEYGVGIKDMLDEMTDMMSNISVQFSKAECLDLPEKLYRVVQIDMEPKQRELYNKIERFILLELQHEINKSGRVNPTSSFGKIAKLCEAANGWIYDSRKRPVDFPWNPKMKALLECVSEIDFTKSKLVVWGRFVQDFHLIMKELRSLYGSESVACMHGGTKCRVCGSNKDTRYSTVTKFNDLESELKIVVVSSSVGSHGIDLTGADYEIFYSNSYSKTDRLQAEDRCHREGMRDNLTILDLIMKNSIDEDIMMALKYHKSITQALMERLGAKEGLVWDKNKEMFVRSGSGS